ncbi:MAG: FAD-dependent oxidoreductase [Thermoguttaceae bacterium]|nr:FAD-dependent oxidoreductase [Thermoguttaceae bacterium]
MSENAIPELEKKIENVVVIGSGPAAWSAAIYAARAAFAPVVFEGAFSGENQEAGTLPMGQLATTTEVENYPGFPTGDLATYLTSALGDERSAYLPPEALESGVRRAIFGPALVELMRRQAENFGARIVSEDVVSVDFSQRPFRLTGSDGETVWARSVIVATGASARWLGLPSETRFKNRGVGSCAVCDGALPRFRNRPIVVVGGGDSAVEDAEYLAKFASKVYLVHRRDALRASKILARRAEANPKIEFVWNRVPEEILGTDEAGVTGVRLASVVGEPTLELEASGVFIAIGHRPNVAFLGGQLELTENGFIKRTVPFRTETSVAGVFVAGDVADERYRQAIVAAASGSCAALDAERFLATSDE